VNAHYQALVADLVFKNTLKIFQYARHILVNMYFTGNINKPLQNDGLESNSRLILVPLFEADKPAILSILKVNVEREPQVLHYPSIERAVSERWHHVLGTTVELVEGERQILGFETELMTGGGQRSGIRCLVKRPTLVGFAIDSDVVALGSGSPEVKFEAGQGVLVNPIAQLSR
jgi:hypothetical protein